ncbi:MAG: FAD-binding oxidoreductase, partial [Frankiales bacterium]
MPSSVVADLSPTGWGDPARRTGLPPHAAAFLQEELGATRPTPAGAPPPLTASALPEPAAAALRAVVGAEHVLVDDDARLVRAAGRSYLDLLRLRGSATLDAPDAVVLPGTAAEVAGVLRACADAGVAVV